MALVQLTAEKVERTLFQKSASKIVTEERRIDGHLISFYISEFWSAKQRQGHSLHEISYRACFKPQLPHFFIQRFTSPGDVVFDPFSGRGTTVIEAALMGRRIISNDVNPLSEILIRPRLSPPSLEELEGRLYDLPIDYSVKADLDLGMFYHPKTEAELVSLKRYLEGRARSGDEDILDAWIRMVATNRLTGHSAGFFSVYTLPPNQAVSPERQRRINERRNQVPEYRDTRKLILRKSRSLLRGVTPAIRKRLHSIGETARFLRRDATSIPEMADDTVNLVVTSPPFLNVVQYQKDNWLRLWFNGIDGDNIRRNITVTNSLKKWLNFMEEALRELFRVVKSGGWVAFEVGEVNKGKVKLEELVVPLGEAAGFQCVAILVNQQAFTKTANIWGITNNKKGTNSNRIILFSKP